MNNENNINQGKTNYQNIDDVKFDFIKDKIQGLDLMSRDESENTRYLFWMNKEIYDYLQKYCDGKKITVSQILNKIILEFFKPEK